MTNEEVRSIINLLKAHYPYFYNNITTKDQANEIVEVWKIQFEGIDYKLIKMAVLDWGKKQDKAPSIAELRRYMFNYYTTVDRELSELYREPTADQERIKELERWRIQLWGCKSR